MRFCRVALAPLCSSAGRTRWRSYLWREYNCGQLQNCLEVVVTEKTMSVYEKLEALNITLPQPVPPVAAFVPFVRTGNLLFLSGHIAKKDGKPWTGQLGL